MNHLVENIQIPPILELENSKMATYFLDLKASPLPLASHAVAGFLVAGLVAWQ